MTKSLFSFSNFAAAQSVWSPGSRLGRAPVECKQKKKKSSELCMMNHFCELKLEHNVPDIPPPLFQLSITFYPIHRSFLCWLKNTLKQTVSQLLLPAVSHPHFSDAASGWSVISVLLFSICLLFPFIPSSIQAWKVLRCWTNSDGTSCFFCKDLQNGDMILDCVSPTLSILLLVQTFYNTAGRKWSRYLCMKEALLWSWLWNTFIVASSL